MDTDAKCGLSACILWAFRHPWACAALSFNRSDQTQSLMNKPNQSNLVPSTQLLLKVTVLQPSSLCSRNPTVSIMTVLGIPIQMCYMFSAWHGRLLPASIKGIMDALIQSPQLLRTASWTSFKFCYVSRSYSKCAGFQSTGLVVHVVSEHTANADLLNNRNLTLDPWPGFERLSWKMF